MLGTRTDIYLYTQTQTHSAITTERKGRKSLEEQRGVIHFLFLFFEDQRKTIVLYAIMCVMNYINL